MVLEFACYVAVSVVEEQRMSTSEEVRGSWSTPFELGLADAVIPVRDGTGEEVIRTENSPLYLRHAEVGRSDALIDGKVHELFRSRGATLPVGIGCSFRSSIEREVRGSAS